MGEAPIRANLSELANSSFALELKGNPTKEHLPPNLKVTFGEKAHALQRDHPLSPGLGPFSEENKRTQKEEQRTLQAEP